MVPGTSTVVPNSHLPADLTCVVAAWDRLPQAIKVGILALVQAAGGPNG